MSIERTKLPFSVVSSSAISGYSSNLHTNFKSGSDITGHHQDTYGGLENEPLQSPFTKQHVGGEQHRHIEINTGQDNDLNRPESFKIKPESAQLKIYGPDFENINKPRAQSWRGAKSPINISNIQNYSNIVGNFNKNYEIFQTVGRGITNNLIVDNFIASGNLTTQFIVGAHNYSLPNIINNSDSIIVGRFNAPGGKFESSRGALERTGEELSPNNSLTTRNISVRQPFYSQLTQHSPQFGSSSEGVSIHKVNRNNFKTLLLSGSTVISGNKYDNFWIQYSLPRSDFGYAWITASTISNPYTIGTSSLQYDLTSSLNRYEVDLSTQTLIGSTSGSGFFSSWKQIRTGEHPITKKQKSTNILAIEDESIAKNSIKLNSLNKSKRSGTSTNFKEPLVSIKNYPIIQEIQFTNDPDGTYSRLKYSYLNLASKFANEDLDTRLGLSNKQVEFYKKIVDAKNITQNSPIKNVLNLNFKETLYPREVNTFLSGTRSRTKYILNEPGFDIDGYDRQLGTQRVFWRDKQQDRQRSANSDGGHINSLGYSSILQSGSSFNINSEAIFPDESLVFYTSSFVSDIGLNTNLFNSILILENSSSQIPAFSSEQNCVFDGKEIFNKKISKINSISGELNEQFVDSYGIGLSDNGVASAGFGSIYRRTYYKSITQQPPYQSGSIQDQFDSVVMIQSEDDNLIINPKPRYLAFLGGVQISNNAELLSKHQSKFDNIFEQTENNTIIVNNSDIIYSTIDNGLLRKTEQISGKKPFFDSYEDFCLDIKNIAKDYSIIPEFRISNHIKYYISSSGGNFRNKNRAIFEIDGNGVSNRSSLTERSEFNVQFIDSYLKSEELENNINIEDDYSKQLEQNKISLTMKGIKKLLPYNGFYPQERITQIASLYSEYAEKNLVGGLYNVGYEQGSKNDNLFSHVETTSSLNSVSSMSSLKFSSSLSGEYYYIAVGHHNFDFNRGSVKIFRSNTDSPFDSWDQQSIIQYTGSTTDCFFGQSVVLLSSSNGLNLFATEFGQNRTGSIYQMTSSDGINWSEKQKIINSGNPITGNIGTYFGNYLDGLTDGNKNVLAITETGFPISFENGDVYATHLSGSDLYIGGTFKSVNGNANIKYLAKLNTITNEIQAIPGINGNIFTLTGSLEKLYVGGSFANVINSNNTVTFSNSIAVYDMNLNSWLDAKLGNGSVGNTVRTIHLSGSDLYIGGRFDSWTAHNATLQYASNILKINNSSFGNPVFSVLGGTLLNGVSGNGNTVYSINSSGSQIYVGGNFAYGYYFNGNPTILRNIARWDQTISPNRWIPLSESVTTVFQQGAGGNTFISASDKANTNYFGHSVGMNDAGNRIIVGAHFSFAGSILNINSKNFSGSLNISSQDNLPRGFYFKNDGTSVYMVGQQNDKVIRYNLSTAFKIDTAVYSSEFSIASQTVTPRGVTFNSSGTRMFIVGGNSVYRYDLSTPWQISSGVSFIGSFSFGTSITPDSIFFDSIGTKMFIGDSANLQIKRYTLSSAYDISSPNNDQNLSVSTYQTWPSGLYFDSSGKELIFCGQANLIKYFLSSPNDLTTAVYIEQTLISEDTALHDVYISPQKNKMFLIGTTNDRIYEYNLTLSGAYESGKVYIYNTSSVGVWGNEQILSASDYGYYDYFGQSVAINSTGNRIVVGAIGSNISGLENAGKAYVYVSSSATGWVQQGAGGNVFISASDKQSYDNFGNSVAINNLGDRIVVGSLYANAGFSNTGKAYVYVSSSGTGWVQQGAGGNAFISASDKAQDDYFGRSVAINGAGDRIIVGATDASIGSITKCGKAYVYVSSSGTGWVQQGAGGNAFISASDKAQDDGFGRSVAINTSGNRIAISSIYADSGTFFNVGKVYIYTSSSIGGWVEEKILTPITNPTNANFGISIKMNDVGDVVIIGDPVGDESGATNAGRAYIYVSSSEKGWTQRTITTNTHITSSDRITNDYFGQSVDINSTGNVVVVGAYLANPGGTVDAGKAYIFSSSLINWSNNVGGGVNDTVNTIKVSGSEVYIGGNFTNIDDYSTSNKVTKYLPSSDTFVNIGNGFNNIVSTLIFSGTDLYAGGNFTTPTKNISKWNGTSWSSPTQEILNNSVFTINFSGTTLYAGGAFTTPSKAFGIYNSVLNSNNWLFSNGFVYIVTSSDGINWSDKVSIISGSNLGKYCSIVSASNGYHVYTTDQSDPQGAIRFVSSSDNCLTWSSGSGNGIAIRSGSNSTAKLGVFPIDATVYNNAGQERVYVFTADKGDAGFGEFYVFSSSLNSSWIGISPTNLNNKQTILTGTSGNSIILGEEEYRNNKTNVNISSLSSSNVLYYSFGIPSSSATNSKVYFGKSYDGLIYEKQNELLISQPQQKSLYGENIDISNISNQNPIFFINDSNNVYSLINGQFVAYRLNIENHKNFAKHAAIEPLFAPGILYNTIKSGIAVDWPCTTGSNAIIQLSGTYGVRNYFYPKNITVKSFDTDFGIANAQGALKTNINYRIPFESIIFPGEIFEPKQEILKDQVSFRPIDQPQISQSDTVYKYLNKSYIYSGYETFIDQLEVTDLPNMGPKRYSVPFVYRKNKINDNGLYTLSVSNFLAEIVKFFLRDEKMVAFESSPDNIWDEFKGGIKYCMDVVLEKSEQLVMIEAYSSSIEPRNIETFNGRYFGYPTNKTTKNILSGEQLTSEESAKIHSDPAYAPYTPPYFEGVAKARISFTPQTTRKYTLDEILENCEIENIYSEKLEEAEQNSDAYKNKMSIQSSIDLKGTTQSVRVTINTVTPGQEVSEEPQSKIWVISPKIETPVLDFSSQNFENYDNKYIKNSGYGRGMWSGYGELPNDGKGIKMRLEYPFSRLSSATTSSLLEQIGFQAEEKNIGKLAETKLISEAIIAIPYLEKEIKGRTTTKNTYFKRSNIHFIKIDKNIFETQKKNIENEKPAVIAGQFGQTQDIQSTSISELIQKMKNYIIPPELNFLQYKDLEPHVMYIFEFEHTLTQQDLADIWQGVMPEISINAERDEITIEHEFSKIEMFGEEKLPKEMKWLIFKAKKKAEYDYFKVTSSTKDDERFKFNKIIGRARGTDVYSYNWPYDYFSLVELAKMDIEINYKKKK